VSSRAKQKQANRMIREQLAAERRRRRTIIVSLIAVVAVLVAGVAGLTLYELQKKDHVTSPKAAITDNGGIATSSGPVTVDLYLDYLCPVCKNFEDTAGGTITQMVKDKKITLVYHPVAILNNSTNPAGYSTRAGSAAGCASDGGKFQEYTSALYAKQPAEESSGLTDDQLVQIGAGVGLIDPTFAQCVRAGTYSSWVDHNTDVFASRGYNGTPTVVVAGKPLANPTADSLTAAVAAAS
jgi:protein-disulfide isomerase